MRKIAVVVLAMFMYVGLLHCQMEYKQNFLLVFNKQPDIKTSEAAYNFLTCKANACVDFNAMKATLTKAFEELSTMQSTVGNAAISPSTPMMSQEEAAKLSEKLKNMTEEEKRQWAMQNARNYTPSAGAHVNRDMNNQPVNDAVKCVTDQQANDLQARNFMIDFTPQFKEIEDTYKPKKDAALKKFQTTTGTTYDPSSSFPYGIGEASEREIAKFNKEVEEYKTTVLPIYNNEMKQKLDSVIQSEQRLVPIYGTVEEKIALTHYADDAREPVNKMHLIGGHLNVLQKVQRHIEVYEGILSDYAEWYAALMKIKSVKEVNNE